MAKHSAVKEMYGNPAVNIAKTPAVQPALTGLRPRAIDTRIEA